jgi:uncharacterized protein YbjT (DUF2867 family)
MTKTALLAGSTGLIGGQLLQLLLNDQRYASVIAISRTPLTVAHPKLLNVVCELKDVTAHREQLKADDVFCCLGTTIKKAKSKEAFRAVDFEAPLALAKMAKEQGAQKYLLVSSLGANKDSGIFYNQVKGEVEAAVQQVGLPSLHIVRPSLLLGPRQEERSGEDAAKIFYKLFGFLVPEKYQAIESIKIARALLAFAHEGTEGRVVHESKDLQKY